MKRRKLEDIEEEAMTTDDQESLKRLYAEHMDAYATKMLQDSDVKDGDPVEAKKRRTSPETPSSSSDPVTRLSAEGKLEMDIDMVELQREINRVMANEYAREDQEIAERSRSGQILCGMTSTTSSCRWTRSRRPARRR